MALKSGSRPEFTSPLTVTTHNPTNPGVVGPRLLAIGLVGGSLSGLFGVGGGVVMVPLLTLWATYGQREAHAISLGAIIPISLAGVVTYGAAGQVDVGYGVALAVGSIAGARIGTNLLVTTSEWALKLAFGAFMLCLAVLLGVRS